MRKMILWCGALFASLSATNVAEAQCSAVSTYPFVEDFDGAAWLVNTTTFDPCWDRVSSIDPDWTLDSNSTGSSNTGPDYDVTGGNYVYLETTGGSEGAEGHMHTPYFDLSGLSNPELNFYYHMYGADMGELVVKASNDSGATWCEVFRVSGQQHYSGTDPWTLATVDLSLVKSSNTLIRFTGIRGGGYTGDMGIDSVSVSNAVSPATCIQPVCFSADYADANFVDLSWTANGTNFDIEVGTVGFAPGTGAGVTATSTATSVQVTGLTQNTNYEAYVRTNCGSGYSDWTGPVSFKTLCARVSTFPFFESFDSTSSWGTYFTIDQCWNTAPSPGYVHSWWVRTGSASTVSGPNAGFGGSGQYIMAEGSYGAAGVTATMEAPEFDFTSLTSPELKFMYFMYGTDMGTLYVETSVDTGATWVAVDSIVGQQQSGKGEYWKAKIVDLGAYNTGLTKVRLRSVKNGYNGDIAVDNFEIREAPLCKDPSDFEAFDITANTVNITFSVESGATRFAEWGPAGFTPGTGMTGSTTGDTLTLTGLGAGQCYDVYLRADCSGAGNGLSYFAGPFSVCTALTPRWIEDFDAHGTYSTWPPENFLEKSGNFGDTLNITSTGWTYDTYMNQSGGDPCAKEYISGSSTTGDWLVGPMVDLGTGVTYNLEYNISWAEFGSNSLDAVIGVDDTVHVAISTDGGLTFDRSNIVASYHQGNPVTLAGIHEVISLTSYTGVINVGLFTTSTVTNEATDVFFDDLEIRTPPACQSPYSFQVAAITDSSASMIWEGDSLSATSTIEYGPEGFTPGSGTTMTAAAADSAFITGLDPITYYDVYVSTACSNGDFSAVSGPYTIFTTCPAVFTTPYMEDFNMANYGTGLTGTGEFENCWVASSTSSLRWESEFTSGSNKNTTSTGPHYDANNPGVSDEGYMFLETTYAGTSESLTSPWIDLSSLTSPTMYFAYFMYGANIGTLTVQVSNDGVNWTDIWTESGEQQTAGTDAWLTAELALSLYMNDTIQLRFVGEKGNGSYGDIAIDAVQVIDGPSCTQVSAGMASNVTATTADLGWSSYSTSDFNIEWGPCGFKPATGQGTVLNNVSSGVAISGMSPNTCYEFYVVNNCNNTDTAGPFAFSSACLAPLNGTYTVGGTPGPNNFASLDSVYQALSCGISGPVVFQLNGLDTLATPFMLSSIDGVSTTNTITFDGMNNSTIYKVRNSGGPFFDVVDQSNVIFQNLSLIDSSTTGVMGIRLMGNSDSIVIQNNNFIIAPLTTSSTTSMVAITGLLTSANAVGADVNYLSVLNNSFTGAYYGVSGYGGSSTTNHIDGLTITGNTFTNHYSYAVNVRYYDDAVISNNVVNRGRSGSAYGIYLYYMDNYTCENNYVVSRSYGIYSSGSNRYSTSDSSRIVNNVLINEGTSTYSSTMYITGYNTNIKVYHNTVVGPGYGLRDYDSENYDYRNNIFVGGDNHAAYFDNAPDSGVDVIDNNLYYRIAGGELAYFSTGYSDLAALQAAYGFANANSVEGDPIFTGSGDYRPVGALANDAGDATVGVAVDIDGNARPAAGATSVDMGAYEFSPVLWDAEATSVWQPAMIGCGDSTQTIALIVRNGGLNDITSLQVGAEVSGDLTASFSVSHTGTIPSWGSDTIVVGTINTYNGGQVTIDGWVALANDADQSNDTTSKASTFISYNPTVLEADTACVGQPITLNAKPQYGVLYGWYENINDTVPVATGDSFTTIADTNQSTYYVRYETRGADTMTTTFAGGSGCTGGNMFDIQLINPIFMDGLALNSRESAGDTAVAVVYYKVGSYVGSELTAGDWTLLDSLSFVSNGVGVPSYASFANAIAVPAGSYAIYVDYNATYSPSAAIYSNADMTITTGVGLCGNFSGLNNPRSFNGSIIYRGQNTCSLLPVSLDIYFKDAVEGQFTSTYVGGNGTGDYSFDGSASTLADSLYWDFGDGVGTASGITPSYTYTNNGTYNVTMYAFGSCGVDTVVNSVIVEGIGLNELTGVSDIRLYPNPSTGVVNLSIRVIEAQEVYLEVVNLQGQVLRAEDLGRVEGDLLWTNDMSTLPKGAYFVRLIGTQGVKTLPITLH